MLKPFYNKKKNIDNRLVPEVSAADAGKVLGVTEDGKIGLVEGGKKFIHVPEFSALEFLQLMSGSAITKIIPDNESVDMDQEDVLKTVLILTSSNNSYYLPGIADFATGGKKWGTFSVEAGPLGVAIEVQRERNDTHNVVTTRVFTFLPQ